jgi:hypothetical protein
MAALKPQNQGMIRYSKRPLSEYRYGPPPAEYGPGTSALLRQPAAWNLAYLSFDYDKHAQHSDPQFTVLVRRTVQTRLDGSGVDVAGIEDHSRLVASLLHLPAARFVHLVKQLPVLHNLPMFQSYGQTWLNTIAERSYLCTVDDGPAFLDFVGDLTQAKQLLSKF